MKRRRYSDRAFTQKQRDSTGNVIVAARVAHTASRISVRRTAGNDDGTRTQPEHHVIYHHYPGSLMPPHPRQAYFSKTMNQNQVTDSYGHSMPVKKTFPETKVIWSERMRDFLSEVSIVGARYVAKPGAFWLRRIIWILFILTGFGMMGFQIHDRIKYFISKPLNVKIQVVHNKTLRFPTVTICNENKLSKAAVSQLGEDVVTWTRSISPGFRFMHIDQQSVNFSQYDFTNFNWTLFYHHMAPAKNDALRICVWDGAECLANVFTTVETNMGICFQFNGEGSNYTSRQPGATYGLKLILFLNQSDYLSTNEGSMAAGFRIALHPLHQIPLMKEWGFRVTPGYQTLVATTLEKVVEYGPPYENCTKELDYSYSRCLATCEGQYIIEKCGCKDIGMLGNATVCAPEQLIKCVAGALTTYIREDLQSECPCMRPCTSMSYKYSLSNAQVSELAIDFMARYMYGSYEVAERAILKDHAMVEIFFSRLSYQEITSTPAYTILALFCDIGGAMGLILGSTFLTVFEVMDFCITTWGCSCYKKTR